ncbi:MAG: methyltransferase type 11, partial [Chthoniobacteraceae bacterium]|nr:methyltransferase type 11 [Chthoniobacteraceae bacterium]
LADLALTTVFTSNFFEHLPDKKTLGRTLDEIARTLTPEGRLIAMGPNIAKIHGRYWDFWDHYLALSERSLCEALRNRGFEIEICHAGFLPYTMEGKKASPLWIVELYLRMPLLWRFLGEQFLVIAKKR